MNHGKYESYVEIVKLCSNKMSESQQGHEICGSIVQSAIEKQRLCKTLGADTIVINDSLMTHE